MSVSGWKTLSDVREWSGGPPECPRVVGRPSQMSEWLGGPPGCAAEVGWASGFLGVVENPSRMSVSSWETHPNVREWSGGDPRCLQVVGRPSRMSRSGREAIPNVRQRSGGPP